jgi:hypothetical protein
MLGLIGILSVSLILCLLYIRKLHRRLSGYEHIWEQIESVADKNLDGTFTIDVRHLEEHTEPYEMHASDVPSGIRLLKLDGTGGLGPHNPRAA